VRFVLFVGVGMTGVVLHLLVLGLLHRLLDVGFLVAQACATLLAMTSNYFLNNVFTYHDQRLHGLALWRGLLTFYLACSIGAVGRFRGSSPGSSVRWPVRSGTTR
jgi:dolichol-phosphate mannosyltransferase